MAILRNIFLGRPDPLVEAATSPAPRFAVDSVAIPPQVVGLSAYSSFAGPVGRVSRQEAIQVPAVKRVRDLIAGSIGGLPLDVIDTEHVTRISEFLDQPEQNVPRSVTMTRTVENLLLEGVAFWQITERYADGYPSYVKNVHPSVVSINDATGEIHVSGKRIASRDLIQFHSPNDGLLLAGARAIRTCLKLDSAAAMYADEPMPTGYFSPTDNADPIDDEDVVDMLGGWAQARQKRSTAYVPAALKYTPVQFTPEQLQLADARQHAVLEIARLASVDPEDVGVSVNTNTYKNLFEKRRAFIDFTLGPYRQAIEDRLSMRDVTKRGYRVKFNLSAFLRSDDKTRMETYRLALDVGAISQDEIRDLEDKPALPPAPRPTPAPIQTPAGELA